MTKKILVTAGATMAPIDKVRAVTNIFKGNTGTRIAAHLTEEGHDVTLITSNPQLAKDHAGRMNVVPYVTFDDLYGAMEKEICGNPYDIIIHSAAVSDYNVTEACVLDGKGGLVPLDSSAKISSDHSEIFLRCVQTPKIVDQIREPWGFKGLLVKFKLQVAITDDELLGIAERSRKASDADMIVANCLEWSRERAFIMSENEVHEVQRDKLCHALHEKLAAAWA